MRISLLSFLARQLLIHYFFPFREFLALCFNSATNSVISETELAIWFKLGLQKKRHWRFKQGNVIQGKTALVQIKLTRGSVLADDVR